jgi:hypothetical protein
VGASGASPTPPHTTKNVKYLAAAGENGFVTDTVQSDLV